MYHRNRSVLVAIWVIGLLLTLIWQPMQSSYAQDPSERKPPAPLDSQRPDNLADANPTRPGSTARTHAELATQIEPTALKNTTTLIVELSEKSVVTTTGSTLQPSAIRAQIARVENAQLNALSAMSTVGIGYRLLYNPQRVFSGLIIEADADAIPAIKQIPGVVDVYPAGVGTIENANSVPFMGGDTVWQAGYTGNGIRIAVIDTGIDYEHYNFDGNGPGTVFPTTKIAGGYDFVGDSWHPDTSPTLVPDLDPMDQQGHGTHMAGTIAGYGIDSGGNTYLGPWNNTTPFGTMNIGPGWAPEATLYALKVGADHEFVSEAGVIAALEWAIDPNGDGDFSDQMDVVNMSIGSGFGDVNRGWTIAANNAAQAGMIVVASATNYGDTYFMQGDPATADWAISVGASDDGNNGGLTADTLWSGSARGPQIQSNPTAIALKPDIVAPGISIFSSQLGTINGGVNGTGTSSASAQVSGAMALLRQQHSDWSVAELKALVMNTATHDLFYNNNLTPPTYGPGRVGAGRLDGANALDTDVIAYNATRPELVSVSFGLLNVVSATTFQRTITVENKGNTTLTYDVTYLPMVQADDDDGGLTPGIGDGGPGVTMGVSPASVTVAPGSTATLTVSLTVDPAAMTRPYTHDPTVLEVFPLFLRYWLAEEAGYAVLTPTTPGPATLRVPVYAAPRPASTMSAAVNPVMAPGTSGTANIPLAGTDVFTGPMQPYDEMSLVSAFELLQVSASQGSLSGMQNSADLQYIGLATDHLAQGSNLSNTLLFFGLSTYGEWSTLATPTRFEVYIDPNQDGVSDYVLWNGTVTGTIFGSAASDELFVFLDNLNTPGTPIDNVETSVNAYAPSAAQGNPNTVAFQNNVVFLPLFASHIAEFVPGDTTFDFWVASYYKDELIDLSEVMTYDIEATGIDLSSGTGLWSLTLYDDWDGSSIPVAYDWAQYAGLNPPCILLLHHHNVPGTRAEIVCLTPDITSDVSLTKQVSNPTPAPGDTVVFTLTVTNQASTPSPNIIVDDQLPVDLTYVSHVASQGSYSPFSGQWTVGSLAAGGSATLDITVIVDSSAEITNIGVARPAVGTDLTPDDNIARAVLNQVPGGDPGSAAGLSDDAQGSAITELPATGYAPQADSSESDGIRFFMALGMLLLLVGVIGFYFRDRLRA